LLDPESCASWVLFSTAPWEIEAGAGTIKLKVVRVLPPFGTKLGRAAANTDLGSKAFSMSK